MKKNLEARRCIICGVIECNSPKCIAEAEKGVHMYYCDSCERNYPSNEVMINSGEYGQKEIVKCIHCLKREEGGISMDNFKDFIKAGGGTITVHGRCINCGGTETREGNKGNTECVKCKEPYFRSIRYALQHHPGSRVRVEI